MNQQLSPRHRFTAACTMEPLEGRRLLAATISGAVLRDITGNGLSADDTGLAGVTVRLYKDLNANGKLDATDGAAISSKVSAAGTGAFAFTGLATGKYVLQDVAGANQVRTWPYLTSTIAVNVTNANGIYNNNKFANYVKDFSASDLTNISYTINGTKTVTNLFGNVKEGDVVTANFTVKAGKTVEVTLVSYMGDQPIVPPNLGFQTISDVATGVFGPGAHSLTVVVPECYFQIDFIGGKAIFPLGPTGSNILYGVQGRLLSWAVGGDNPCEHDHGDEGLTPGFWKNHTSLWQGYTPNQTLESVFNVPNSLGLDNFTLIQALNFGGGGGVTGAAKNLFRQAVAALLNAAHVHVEYALTTTQVINLVNTALASNNAVTIEALKNELDLFNNAGGGIDAHGKPI